MFSDKNSFRKTMLHKEIERIVQSKPTRFSIKIPILSNYSFMLWVVQKKSQYCWLSKTIFDHVLFLISPILELVKKISCDGPKKCLYISLLYTSAKNCFEKVDFEEKVLR